MRQNYGFKWVKQIFTLQCLVLFLSWDTTRLCGCQLLCVYQDVALICCCKPAYKLSKKGERWLQTLVKNLHGSPQGKPRCSGWYPFQRGICVESYFALVSHREQLKGAAWNDRRKSTWSQAVKNQQDTERWWEKRKTSRKRSLEFKYGMLEWRPENDTVRLRNTQITQWVEERHNIKIKVKDIGYKEILQHKRLNGCILWGAARVTEEGNPV